jgi:PAS domain S-box-containing protein
VVGQLHSLLQLDSPGVGPGQTLLVAASFSLAYLVVGASVREGLRKTGSQWRSRSGIIFLLFGCVLGSFAVAVVSTINLVMFGFLSTSEIPVALFDSALGAATGILSLTPLLLISLIPTLENILGKVVSTGTSGRYTPSFRAGISLVKSVVLNSVVTLSILWLIFSVPVEGELQRFCLLLLVLVGIALLAGLEGVTWGGFFLISGCMGVVRYLELGSAEIVELQILLLVSYLTAILVGSAVTEGRSVHEGDSYRNAVLSSVSFAAERLVGVDDWRIGFSEVLRRIGVSSNVSRVYVFENRSVEGQPEFEALPYEWTATEMWSDQHQLKLVNQLQSHFLSTQNSALVDGEVFLYRNNDLPDEDQPIFRAIGIKTSVVIPIVVEQKLWGCLGLDRSANDQDWVEYEIDALQAAARSLGTLVARAKIEEQFRQLTGNIRAVFWTSSADGRSRTYVSPAYEQIWGQSLATLQEKPDSWLDAIHSEDAQRVESALLEKGEYKQEYRIVLPDRSLRWIRDQGFPVRIESGEISKIVGIAEDVTEQKKVEDKIKNTTQLMSALIDNLGSGILVEDDGRRVRYVNRAFKEMFGIPVPKESLLGMDSRLLFTKSKALGEQVDETRSAAIEELGVELTFEGRILERDYVPLDVSELDHYHFWHYKDITEQKQAECQIKASLGEKEVLLQEVHHRVKNNLQVISSLLNLQSAGVRNQKAAQILADSQNRVKAMALVHEQLYKSLDLSAIDFSGYVRSLSDHLVRSYRTSAGSVNVKLDLETVPMNVDTAISCGLIISELVSNSLKYAFPSDQEGEILIRLNRLSNGELRLQVRDNGVGIQEDLKLKEMPSLGLKLVHSLTNQLNGEVSFGNNDGTEFEIRFTPKGESQRGQLAS